MTTYNKPPLTFQQQVELLKSRGLEITDEQRAIRHLTNISYYRLSAYMLPFKIRENGQYTDQFITGTKWENIHALYVFDRKLRLLVFDAIERIEIGLRTQIIYQLSLKYGSHWHDRSDIFKLSSKYSKRTGKTITTDIFHDLQQHIQTLLVSNHAEVFIKHYKARYDEPVTPPSWMSVETLYFSHLSKICENLRQRADRVAIASRFDLPPEIFCSWLHTINNIRNICAHHGRLWNRTIDVVPEKLHVSKSNVKIWITEPERVKRSKIYYFLCMINYLLQTVNPTSDFKNRLSKLLYDYPNVALWEMGFPKHWQRETMWKID